MSRYMHTTLEPEIRRYYLAKLRDALATPTGPAKLAEVLSEYENTGDHDHGHGPLSPNEACAGPAGDCLVFEARVKLARMWGAA